MKNLMVIVFFLISIIGNSQNFKISKVENLIEQKRYDYAFFYIDSLEKHFDKDKKVIIKYYKAKYYYYVNEFYKSIDYCTSAIQEHTGKDSLLIDLYSIRMDNYRKLEKFDLAINDNIFILELTPRSVPYYVNLSYLYGVINDRQKSIKILEKALKIEPDNYYVYNNLAYSNSMIGNYKNAIKFANKGLTLAKDSIWIGILLNNRGYAKLNLKQYDSALQDINESLKKYPTNSFAYYYKALTYIQLEKKDCICSNLELARAYGGINMTRDLIDKYCKK